MSGKIFCCCCLSLLTAVGCNPKPESLSQKGNDSNLSNISNNIADMNALDSPMNRPPEEVAVVPILADDSKLEKVKLDEQTTLTKQSLSGTWRLTFLTSMELEYLNSSIILFEVDQDKYRFLLDDQVIHSGRIELNTKKDPIELDMHVVSGDNQGEVNRNIARINQGKLELCQGVPGTDRPKNFQANPALGITMAVFEKVEKVKQVTIEPE